MVDLVITPANVRSEGGASLGEKTSGVALTAGQVLTLDTDATAILASDATVELARAIGIALQNVGAGQPIKYQSKGRINLGATLEVGKHYVLSAAGAIAPVDDIEPGNFATYLGWAESTSILRLQPLTATVAAAAAVV